MKLRAPAYPLITIDPYFSVWSASDHPADTDTVHWTNRPITLSVIANVDNEEFRLVGKYNSENIPQAELIASDCDAFSTVYSYLINGVKINLKFTSPVIPNDLYMLSRPISYLEITKESVDNKRHTVFAKVEISEEICTHLKGDCKFDIEQIELGKYSSIKIGRTEQNVLERDGDDLRIEWGYFYLTGMGEAYSRIDADGLNFVGINTEIKSSQVLTFAYDDIESINYFGKNLKTYWNKEAFKFFRKVWVHNK